MTEIGRNEPCPCGSGLKYKRCCLRRGDDIALDALEAERVWGRMQSWAFDRFGDELHGPLQAHMDARGVGGEERPANEHDLSLALCWLLVDREVAAGGTPARLYSQLPELSADERELAARIAASRLGVYRVTDVEPGAWIELESVIAGVDVRVSSPLVSREAIAWHVLLCRVMEGGPTFSLWGAAAFYEPAEESELLLELRRIADEHDLGAGAAGLDAALRVGAGELVCFSPPSRRAERVPYTLEGDRVAMAQATWKVRERDLALQALRAVPELALDGETEDGEGVSFDWLALRRELLAHRPPLPVGAICMEGGPVMMSPTGTLVELDDVTSLGTFTLRADRLEFFALSQERLEGAVALVERHLQGIAGSASRSVQSVEDALSERRAERAAARVESRPARARTPGATPSALGSEATFVPPDTRLRELTYRRWIDDPNQHLGGLSPREAATRPECREALERQLRSIEFASARGRADRCPGPEVTWLRGELRVASERLAA
ncbi:MAG: SEC-C domain-containing protein [Solirubrobacteraceae bacterium]